MNPHSTLVQDHASSVSPAGCARISQVGHWTIHEHGEVTSTNLVAAQLPAWHAVRADVQTAGRGRFQRRWISDRGGLWLSAVLPLNDLENRRPLIPLTIGWAVCQALEGVGLHDLRLRWPNDVLVRDLKLAGLLIDQLTPGLIIAGIGINVANQPEVSDPQLRGTTVRLADLLPAGPQLGDLMTAVLGALAKSWTLLKDPNRLGLLESINSSWHTPRQVEIALDGSSLITGEFVGVDPDGRLMLDREGQPRSFFEPHQVRLLRDIP